MFEHKVDSGKTVSLASAPTPATDKETDVLSINWEGTSPPIDARLLGDLASVYLAHVRSTKAEQTAINYGHHLAPFLVWWSEYGPPHEHTLTDKALEDCYTWLMNDYRTTKGKPPALATLHSVATRIRMFLHWLYTTKRLPIDISGWMQIPPEPGPRDRYLDLAQCQALFDACKGTLRVRDHAILAMLLGVGCRQFEAAEALKEDIVFAKDMSGHLRLRKVKYDAEGRKKGRLVVFGPTTGFLLRLHMISNADPDDPRLLQVTDTTIKNRLRELSKRAGFVASAHDFRRTFSDYWVDHSSSDNGLALLMLRLQLGHAIPADDTTAKHYLDNRNPAKLLDRLARHYASPVELICFPEW